MTALPVEYRPAAKRDLLRIHEYLTREVSLELADRFLLAAEQCVEQIARAPYAGPLFPTGRLPALEIRRWSVKGFPRYSIFYAVSARKVSLLRILHGARDLPRQPGL